MQYNERWRMFQKIEAILLTAKLIGSSTLYILAIASLIKFLFYMG